MSPAPGRPEDPAVPPAPDDLLSSSEAGGTAIRGGVLRTAGFVVGLLLALASAPLLVRHLGTEGFGRYSSVLAVIAIVTGLTEGGVNTVALRELSAAGGAATRSRIMSDLLGLRLVLGTGGIMLATGFSVVAGYGPDLVTGTFLAGLGMLATVTQTLVASELQSRLRFGLAAAVDLFRQALTTSLIVVLVIGGAGVVSFLAMSIPAGVASLALTVMLVRGSIGLRPAFHPRRWVPLLRDTAVFAVAIAVNSLYFRATLVVMSLVTTAEQTGHFSVSFRVVEVLIGVPALLVGSAFPIISRAVGEDRARFDVAVARLFELGVLAGALASLASALLAPFAIGLLTGDTGDPAVVVLQIQSLALLASFTASATGYPLLSLHRHKQTLVANVASLVVVLVMAVLLGRAYGAVGAAAAAVSADVVLATLNTLYLRRDLGANLRVRMVFVAVLAGAAGFITGTVVPAHPIVQLAAGASVYLFLLWLLKSFPPEVREVLARRTGLAGPEPKADH